jgi:translation initiation factor 5B
MAKKDKKSKKARDDSWENEIDTAPPTHSAPVSEPVEKDVSPPTGHTAPTEATENDFGGGGLLSVIRKNRADRKKKGKKTADIEVSQENDITPDGSGTPTGVDQASPVNRPTEITEIDDDHFGPVKKGGKESKPELAPEAAAEVEDGGGRVKSKKEKEREKKEREKQRKKEQVCFGSYTL